MIKREAHVLSAPPWGGKTLSGSRRQMRVRFKQVSARSNMGGDSAAWFRRHGLKLPAWEVPNSLRGIKGNCPPRTPLSYKKRMLVTALRSDIGAYFIYGVDYSSGRFLVLTDPSVSKVLDVLDFKNYMSSPRYRKADRGFISQSVNWVTQDGDTLYVSTGHNTYARIGNSKGILKAFWPFYQSMLGPMGWQGIPKAGGQSGNTACSQLIFSGVSIETCRG